MKQSVPGVLDSWSVHIIFMMVRCAAPPAPAPSPSPPSAGGPSTPRTPAPGAPPHVASVDTCYHVARVQAEAEHAVPQHAAVAGQLQAGRQLRHVGLSQQPPVRYREGGELWGAGQLSTVISRVTMYRESPVAGSLYLERRR